MSKALNILAAGWTLVILTIIIHTDFALPKVVCVSDYLMTFHTAGRLLVEGRVSELYPPDGAKSFIDAPFDRASHRIVPDLPQSSTSEYMYPPLCTVVWAPFSYLPLQYSLAAWQIVSVVAVMASSFLIWRGTISGDIEKNRERISGLPLWTFLTFLPTAITVWIGQVGIILGVLPLSAGYFFHMRKKYFIAGLIWALAALKPQFLAPILTLLAVQCLQRRFRAALGFASGVALIAGINVVCFTPNLMLDWLRCLKLSDAIYSDTRYGVASHLMVSLSRAVVLLFPVDQQAPVKIAMLSGAALLLLATVVLLFKNACLSENKQQSDTIAFATGALIAPLVVPYLFLYDLCIWIIPGIIAANLRPSLPLSMRFKQIMIGAWAAANLYTAFILFTAVASGNMRLAMPIIFVFSLLFLWGAVCVNLIRTPKAS